MIFVTGDTHIPIDLDRFYADYFPEQNDMTKSDYVIICGDFGGIWDGGKKETNCLNWLNSKNFTTLFIDGNHENHKMLHEKYAIVEYCGGKAHKIADSLYHLMRGEVFILDSKKFFTMGGASSHDKQYRRVNVSWWAEEMPSDEEYQNALDNLDKHNWTVDFVLSHCCPDSIQDQISKDYEQNRLTHFFEHVIKANCHYQKWFFGHYHVDRTVDDKHICLYYKFVKL